jgi:succinyl-CoA synthetase beta subunit
VLLIEAKGKELLAAVGIAIPKGWFVQSLEDLKSLDIEFPIAIKAQVASGGRGKSGGVQKCLNLSEAEAAFESIMKLQFSGEFALGVLIEPWLPIAREIYLSVAMDGRAGGFAVLYSPTGGVEIEKFGPAVRYPIGLSRNFRAHEFRKLLEKVESDHKVREHIVMLARRILQLAQAYDCLTVEINPLVQLSDGTILAGDAKVVRDDSSAFRHLDLQEELAIASERDPRDLQRCREARLMLVQLEGDIGVISGGAGLTMATMDAIDAAGGKPACFLDCSGNPTPAGFSVAFDYLNDSPNVKSILVSMFGGGLHTDRVARSILDILATRKTAKPVVFRLNGTGSVAAAELLTNAGYHNHSNLEAAVKDVIAKAGVTA